MKRNRTIGLLIALVLVLAGGIVGCDKDEVIQPQANVERIGILDAQGYGITGWNGSDLTLYSDAGGTPQVFVEGSQGLVQILVPTAVGTATPVVVIDSKGALSNPLEVRKNATPVFVVDADGNVTYTGISSAGGLVGAAVGVRAPTAVGTATPAFFVDSTGGVSNPFEVRYSATPVAVVSSAGGLTAADLTATDDVLVGDDLTVTDDADVQGDLLANTATITGTLGVSGLFTSISTVRKVIAKTADASLTAAECYGTVVSDLGNAAAITITLPAAVAGMDVLLYNKTGETWIVDCDAADQIFDLTNAAGDSITNTTAYDYVHLVALDATGWYTLDVHGTWSDAN